MITAYIDGDWILYAAGFAGQKNKYVMPAEFGALEFETLTAIKELCAVEDVEYDRELVYNRIVMDPDEHILHSAKNMIESNCEKIAERFGEEVRPVVLLDGDGNYRCKLATIAEYKGNRRKGDSKPLAAPLIREYLIDRWDAYIVFDQETDDEMAIRQSCDAAGGYKSVIVSIDKDMLQVPGWHLNPNKGFRNVTKPVGLKWQYQQCLQGDSVDNIKGCYKVGEVLAERLVKECKSEKQLWAVTLDAYETSIEKHGNQYNGLTAEEAALENMRLVYLRRRKDEPLWLPPGVRHADKDTITD